MFLCFLSLSNQPLKCLPHSVIRPLRKNACKALPQLSEAIACEVWWQRDQWQPHFTGEEIDWQVGVGSELKKLADACWGGLWDCSLPVGILELRGRLCLEHWKGGLVWPQDLEEAAL